MKIEILCTGDEILTGKTVNTNFSYIAQRLTENALNVSHGTTVGDDRDSLIKAFSLASERADAVIVNGGLGPTVDDLSQEVAAEAAGVSLECHSQWLEQLEKYYANRGRKMPENNKKQAMLPAGAELIDNPIGTACGFAIQINKARFFFTPGVPREMHRMITEQVLPRILSMTGSKKVTRLKRFHTFGIGESRADQMLAGAIDADKEHAVKLGFQTHYPQLETKLSIHADNNDALEQLLAPAAAELRNRLGNYILCEDDSTLEGVILEKLSEANQSLSCMEMSTGGSIANRLMKNPLSGQVLKQCIVSPDLNSLGKSVAISNVDTSQGANSILALKLAEALKKTTDASHAISVITSESTNEQNSQLHISIGIASPSGSYHRQAILPGRTGWTRLGAAELGLDCLRRHLAGLPIDEKIDFEQQ